MKSRRNLIRKIVNKKAMRNLDVMTIVAQVAEEVSQINLEERRIMY